MLIRLCDHFKDNPKRIDKLIAIKGLPKEWMFRETPEGTELKKPWEADIDENIPESVRHLCDPIYMIFRFASVSPGGTSFMEKRRVLGVKIDFNTEPGRQMWEDVERYIEETIPRNERVPVPVLCAKDERSSFETYTPRRNSRGSLELVPSSVPLVDLDQYAVKTEKITEPVVEEKAPEMEPEPAPDKLLKCERCDYTHKSRQGILMHGMRMHKKEKVGVS